MTRLNTRSFPCYCVSCSAERGVASVLRSAAVKKVFPILSIRVEKLFLCLSAILNLRNACVLFEMVSCEKFSVYEGYKRCSFFLSRRTLQNKKKSASINPVCLNFTLACEYRMYVENRF
jgi:hypothetical protein